MLDLGSSTILIDISNATQIIIVRKANKNSKFIVLPLNLEIMLSYELMIACYNY